MSLFRVRLSNIDQGTMDRDPFQNQMSTSLQRSIYVTGPTGDYHKLMDGTTFFENTNYWKQFAYPQTTFEESFIDVLGDDAQATDNFSFNTGTLWRGLVLNSPSIIFRTQNKNNLLFNATSDDFAVMMPINQKITCTYDSNKNYVYTLPDKNYIIFNNTSGWFIPGPGSITVTDGTHRFSDISSNFYVSNLKSVGFKTRNWSDGVAVDELRNWGVIDDAGIAYFKFVFFGDSGVITINSLTAS